MGIDRRDPRALKALADFKAQMDRPFEHEARLKELLVKQAQLNAALDLDKHDAQTVPEMPEAEKTCPPALLPKFWPMTERQQWLPDPRSAADLLSFPAILHGRPFSQQASGKLFGANIVSV